MSRSSTFLFVRVLGLALLAGFLSSTANLQAQDNRVDFAVSIKPLFEKHCITCHGPTKEESFRIDVEEDLLDFIETGSAEESRLYEVLVSDDEDELMPPPDEGIPLSKDQIALVMTWINEGADWPDEVKLEEPAPEDANQETGGIDGGDESTAQAKGGDDPQADDAKDADDPQVAGAKPKPDKAKDAETDRAARKTRQVQNAIGSLHPAVIHLPIGLLLASGIFALFSLRGNFVMSDCAYYCLWLGTLGAIVACVSGWYFSPMENRGTVSNWADLTDMTQKIFWHRTSALIATSFALLLAMFASSARNRDPDDGIMWKLGLILLAVGIGFVGHEGGELTHGKDLYKDLKTLSAETFPSVFGGLIEPEKPDASKQQPEKEPAKPDDEIGKSSDET